MSTAGQSLLVVCGEASGDLLAAGVVRALAGVAPGVRAYGMGGDQCRAAGVETVLDCSQIAVMGIAEVVPALPRVFAALWRLTRLARERRPSAALLVDAPDFNLRLAPRLRALGVPVVGYVSPTVWAWRAGRVRRVARDLAALCCVLPFEPAFYEARGYAKATYVGHPLLDAPASRPLSESARPPRLALLPGSRRQEVRRLAPRLAAAAARLVAERPSLDVVAPVASGLEVAWVAAQFARGGLVPRCVCEPARDVLAASDAAVVASGTATLEAALAGTPHVVVYAVSPLTWAVARLFVRTPFVGLPNLVAGRAVVPELLQRDCNEARIAREVAPLLDAASPGRAAQVAAFADVRASLGAPGASARVAAEILRVLSPQAPHPQELVAHAG